MYIRDTLHEAKKSSCKWSICLVCTLCQSRTRSAIIPCNLWIIFTETNYIHAPRPRATHVRVYMYTNVLYLLKKSVEFERPECISLSIRNVYRENNADGAKKNPSIRRILHAFFADNSVCCIRRLYSYHRNWPICHARLRETLYRV